MSRIGKKPIVIPSGVDVRKEGGFVFIKGPKGEIKRKVGDAEVLINIRDGLIEIKPAGSGHAAIRAWGTYASHLKNMIRGITEGYSKTLELEGIGYRAEVQAGKLSLSLGFSHPVFVEPLEGITFQVNKKAITISGIDREKVGLVAAHIRAFKKPEPYKGKGIRYRGEIILRKAGKKAATAAG